MSQGDWGIRMLMVTLGLFVILRSVNKDGSGRTLIDHLLGNPAGTTATNTNATAAAAAANAAAPSAVGVGVSQAGSATAGADAISQAIAATANAIKGTTRVAAGAKP
jgi:hypothetical protein